MPSIAEILAARSRKTAVGGPSAEAAQPAARRESIAESMVATEAIDRIDPPGKRQRPSAAPVIRKEAPVAKVAENVPQPEDPEARELGRTEGESIPLIPAEKDPALQALENELCVMTDPRDPEACWLTVRRPGFPLVFLFRLPLWEHPDTTGNEPF